MKIRQTATRYLLRALKVIGWLVAVWIVVGVGFLLWAGYAARDWPEQRAAIVTFQGREGMTFQEFSDETRRKGLAWRMDDKCPGRVRFIVGHPMCVAYAEFTDDKLTAVRIACLTR